MQTARIGQILRDLQALTEQDVFEILAQQRRTGQKFGQIALSWGLIRPEQLWEAWCRQLADRNECIDLDSVGVDTRAAEKVEPEFAHRCKLLPIRLWGRLLVVAAPETCDVDLLDTLAKKTGCVIHACRCSETQIEKHLRRVYEPAPV